MGIAVKHKLFIAFFFTSTILGFTSASAGTIEGTIQGFNCTVYDKGCAMDRNDPRLHAERLFVILDQDNAAYLVPNLDRTYFAWHFARKARVTGEVQQKYNSVVAEKFEVFVKGKWETVWTAEMERIEREGWGY